MAEEADATEELEVDTPERAKKSRAVFVAIALTLMLLSGIVMREALPYFATPEPVAVEDGVYVEKVASDLGDPSCLHWIDQTWLLVCDRGGRILALELNEVGDLNDPLTVLDGLTNPHGALIWVDPSNGTHRLFVSETGKLTGFTLDSLVPSNWSLDNGQVLVSGVPSGNHQTNSVMPGADGSLIWHSGSTCNVCEEEDERNAALLTVDPWSGETELLATGVRNSYDGVWVPDIGYLFTDNGRDWEGDHPPEELNLLSEGAAYGWPDDDPSQPVPTGTVGPIAEFAAHSSANGIDLRPANSTLPGGNYTVYVTIFGSWNTVIPVGKEIVRVDLVPDPESEQGWKGEVTKVVTGLQTPLPLRFHPNGDLYFAEYAEGSLFRVTGEV